MAGYVIGQIEVRDAARWQEYVSQVGATIAAAGGEVLFRGERQAVFSGPPTPSRVVAIRFESVKAAEDWHNSPQYQRLIPLRDAAASVTLVVYEG
ncbi:MAG TPA: DUF1330 domain-containing protein [Usitatibacteraceae bacterium]|nr:DUF1330 domain-containing protein [Usitatibacteraceae bacterium]